MQLSKTVGDWSAAITTTVNDQGLLNGEIEWFTVGAPATPYDPATPGSGEPTEDTIAATPARIQHLREPRDATNSYQWTEYRRIRAQIPFSEMHLAIQKGVKGRITDGGKDPNLVGLILIVQDGRNSSWAALRTLECTVESVGAPPSA